MSGLLGLGVAFFIVMFVLWLRALVAATRFCYLAAVLCLYVLDMRFQCFFQADHGIYHRLVDLRPFFFVISIAAEFELLPDTARTFSLKLLPFEWFAEDLLNFVFV